MIFSKKLYYFLLAEYLVSLFLAQEIFTDIFEYSVFIIDKIYISFVILDGSNLYIFKVALLSANTVYIAVFI